MTDNYTKKGRNDDVFSEYTAFASIDVGQEYCATAIFTRCEDDPDNRFVMVHCAIDEFMPGHAPHQPVKQGDDALDKEKKRKIRHLNDMEIAFFCAQLVKRYLKMHGIQHIFIEDQLTAAKRNRSVQMAIFSACVMSCISVSFRPPISKFMFKSVLLQEALANHRKAKTKGTHKGLKEDSVYITHKYLATLNNDVLSGLADFQPHFNGMACVLGLEKAFSDHTSWYHKDLADAFLQAITSVGLMMTREEVAHMQQANTENQTV